MRNMILRYFNEYVSYYVDPDNGLVDRTCTLCSFVGEDDRLGDSQ